MTSGDQRREAPRTLSATEAKRLSREWRRAEAPRLALLLERVQTPYNTGAIVRTAAAFRVEHLWLAADACSPSHPGSRKTSLGTERYLAWTQTDTAAEAAEAAKGAGYRVVAVELATGAVPLWQLDLNGAVCLAFGNEDRGLTASALAAADSVGYLPLPGKVGSLNVAAAASIAIAEARRQHWQR